MDHQRAFGPLPSQASLTDTSNCFHDYPLGISTFPEIDTSGSTAFPPPIPSLVGDVRQGLPSKDPASKTLKSAEAEPQVSEKPTNICQPTEKVRLVGDLKSSLMITEEYAKSDPMSSERTTALLQQYSHYRHILGDGNSGWRALGFSYFEALAKQGDKNHIQEERMRITSLKNMLIRVGGFNERIFEDMLKGITNILGDLTKVVSTTNQQPTMLLLTRFNNIEVSNSIVNYLRLLASSWLKGHSSLYESFIPPTLGIDGYCKDCLEAPNKELDTLGMTILVDALIKPSGFAVKIVHLHYGDEPQIDTHLIEAGDEYRALQNPNSLVIHLLRRLDCYDILYQSTSALPLLSKHDNHQSSNLQVVFGYFSSFASFQPTMPDLGKFSNDDLASLMTAPGFLVPPSLGHQGDKCRSLFVAMQIDQSNQKAQSRHESPTISELEETMPDISPYAIHENETRHLELLASTSNLQNRHSNEEQNEGGNEVEEVSDPENEMYFLSDSHSESNCGNETYFEESDSTLDTGDKTPNQIWQDGDISHCNVTTQKGPILPLLEPAKQKIVNQIMERFWKIFHNDQRLMRSNIRSCATPHSSSSKVTSDKNPLLEKRKDTKGKRQQPDSDDQASGDDDKEDPKRFKFIASVPEDLENKARFACPYRKHDPQKYCVGSWKICALTEHRTVARVKEHLYRYHRVYQCPRCKEPFKLEKEFQHHSEATEACESKPMKAVEGITNQTEKLLHNRKKAYRGQTEKERWEEIYKILFPFDKLPSPYFEPIQEQPHCENNIANAQPLDDYEAYVRRELPRSFRAELETAVNDEVGPIEERLMNRIMDMYQTCQERVLSTYRSNQAANSCSERSHTTTSRLGEEESEAGEGILQKEQGLGESSAKTTLLGDVEDLADGIMTFQPPSDSLLSPSTQNLKKLTQVTACDRFALTEGSVPSYHQKDFASLWHPNSSRPFPNESTIDSIAEEHKFFNTEHLSQPNPGGANSSMSAELWKLCEEVMPSTEDFISDTPIFPKELDKAGSCIEAQGNFDWESFLNIGTLADAAR